MARSFKLITAIALAAPALAWGHPGHDSGGFLPGFLHPFVGWDHLLAMLAVGAWAAQTGGRARWAIPAAFVTAMALGAALAFAGIDLPLIEPAIAASVLLLGLVVSATIRLPVAGGAALVGLLALFHGAAHVADAPQTTAALPYVLGFLLATAALHAAGVTTALILRVRPVVLRLAAAPVALAGAWLLLARMQ